MASNPPKNDGDPNESFIREVDEELARDRVMGFVRTYGRALAVVVGLGLTGLAGFLWWKETRQEKLLAQSAAYDAAIADLRRGDPGAIAALEAVGKDGGQGYHALATLRVAAEHAGKKQNDKALALYDALAKDEAVAPPFRDLARLLALRLRFDTLPPKTAIEALKPLAQDGAPWFATAGEMLAVAYLRNSQPDLALPLFDALSSNKELPASVRARASAMAGMLGKPDAAAATAGEETDGKAADSPSGAVAAGEDVTP